MTFKEVKEFIISGDEIINTCMIKSNKYEVWRNKQKVLTLTYSQFRKITKDLKPFVHTLGFTRHIYTIK